MVPRVLILIGVLFYSSILFAQRQNGSVEGFVKDGDRQALPGVSVMVSSPSLIGGSAIAFTDQNGFYRFPVLAPGRYEVKAELTGFQTLIRRDVVVSVGSTQTVQFSLEMTAVSEAVEVSANPPLIDITTTAVSFIVPGKVIESLPRTNRIQDLIALTPGVSDHLGSFPVNNLVAYGAIGEGANGVWVDGVNVNSPRYGDLNLGYNQNWIEEIQVTGIGAPAEYGGFTGVVANYTTRSGGNDFHGLFETFFQNQNLTSTNVPNAPPKIPFKSYDISAQLGGPLMKDRLWFFSGVQYPHTQSPTPGTDELTTDIFMKSINKVTYQWNKNNTLQGFGTWNDRSFERVGSTPFVTPEANYKKSEGDQWSWNATWISLLNSQTNFEVGFGGFYDHDKDIEENPDLSNHFDAATGISSVNSLSREENKQSRIQANVVFSHHADDFIHGNHDFRFGVQIERSNVIENYQYNGNYRYYDYYGAPHSRYLGGNYLFEGSNHRVSTYAQDDWEIGDRFSLSLGIRWDHNRGSTADRGTVFKTDPVAPRIGFVWSLDSQNQTVIKAHYGDYYDALLERLYRLMTDRFEPFIAELYINGQWVEQFRFIGRNAISEGGLKQPYVRQTTIGIDRVLPGKIPFGAHYIYRRWGNILEDIGQSVYEPVPFVNPLTGETITVYNLVSESVQSIMVNPPGIYRRYDGFELYANKQFAGKLSLSGSLVYSKLSGNFFGNALGQSGSIFLNDPNVEINRNGRLENDRPLSWKIVGTYALPWGFNTGFFFRHESGGTWTTTVRVPQSVASQSPVILAEPLGSQRFPSRNVLDMRVEKEFPLYSGQLRFTVDIFNAFNTAYPLGIRPLFGSRNFGIPGSFTQPRQIRLGVRYTF